MLAFHSSSYHNQKYLNSITRYSTICHHSNLFTRDIDFVSRCTMCASLAHQTHPNAKFKSHQGKMGIIHQMRRDSVCHREESMRKYRYVEMARERRRQRAREKEKESEKRKAKTNHVIVLHDQKNM